MAFFSHLCFAVWWSLVKWHQRKPKKIEMIKIWCCFVFCMKQTPAMNSFHCHTSRVQFMFISIVRVCEKAMLRATRKTSMLHLWWNVFRHKYSLYCFALRAYFIIIHCFWFDRCVCVCVYSRALSSAMHCNRPKDSYFFCLVRIIFWPSKKLASISAAVTEKNAVKVIME